MAPGKGSSRSSARFYAAAGALLLALAALGLWLCGARPVSAEAPALPPLAQLSVLGEVTVDGGRIRLLDLFWQEELPREWAELLAGIDIGPSPGAGGSRQVNPQRLLAFLSETLKAHGVDPAAVSLQVPERITVVRRQMQLTPERVEGIFRAFLEERLPWNAGEALVHDIRLAPLPALPAGELSCEVALSEREDFLGEVSATIHLAVDGQRVRDIRVTARIDLYRELVRTRRAMRRGEVVAEADIEIARTPLGERPERFATAPEQVAGKRLLSSLAAGQPIELSSLANPALLKRGDTVTMVYRADGLRLTAPGRVREEGSRGDTIKVMNLSSKRSIPCQVIDAETVEVIP